jgi:PST family polysaccharide transporter/lipopolysaccharide exporter
VLSIVLVLSGANAVPLAVLQQELKFRQIAEVEFGKTLMQGLTVLACAVSGLRYWSLAIGLIAGYLTAFVLLRRHVRLAMIMPTRDSVGPSATYAVQLVVSSLAWYLYSSGDFAVVGRVAGLAALGYYQFAWNIAQLPGEKLANVLQAVVLPFFGSIGADRAALRHYFLILSELLVSVMLPILLGFALVSPIAVPLIFGDKWVVSISIMQILVACAAMSTVSLLGQHVLGATGNAMVTVRLHVVALFVLPFLFYVGVRVDGPFGVAIAWLVAQPFLVGYPLLKLKHAIDLSVREYLGNLRGPVISAAVMGATVWVLREVVGDLPAIVQLAILISVGAVMYVGVYYGFFRPRVRRILSVWTNR